MAKVAVIGIGNVLAGDDAVGPHVVRVLEARWELPEGVQVIDAGTPGYDLTDFIAGMDAAVLVDAVKARGGRPGELRLYDAPELLAKPPVQAMSPHEPGVREALLHAQFMGVLPPRVRLVGVVPGEPETRIALSAEVRSAIDPAVEAVLSELAALGVAARRREPPRDPDLWWERQPGR